MEGKLKNKTKNRIRFEIREKLVLKEFTKNELIEILEFINNKGNNVYILRNKEKIIT
jgi:hypothetical protein